MDNYDQTNEFFSFNKTQKSEFDIEVEKYEKILVNKVLLKIQNDRSFIEENNNDISIKFDDFYITLSGKLRISIRNRHQLEYKNHLDYKFFNSDNYDKILNMIRDKYNNHLDTQRKTEFDSLKTTLDNN